ncbi:MAG: prolyl oligopeptidase family serine peptidase [Deltaproteobacteria bacterium]|nr:prolyl oligopeptidase family serine peptidase [Deltaproteobacteria bacterium]
MRLIVRCAVLALSLIAMVRSSQAAEPLGTATSPLKPPAPVHPFEESLFGRKLLDPYRYMETMDAETLYWIKAQGAYTRSMLGSIGARSAFAKHLSEFGASFGMIAPPSFEGQPYQIYRHRIFFTKREPGSDNLDLFAKDRNGTRKLVDIARLRAAHDNKPYAINYFEASPDGTKVAVGISEGGSEETSIFVHDALSGARLAGPVDRAQYASPTWSEDGKLLFFNRLAALSPGDAPTAKYLNSTAVVWDLKSGPTALIGTTVGNAGAFNLKPAEFPNVGLVPGAPNALFFNINGVQNELEIWLTSTRSASHLDAPWHRLVARLDDVTDVRMRGSEIFLLSHHGAPTFQVLALRAGQRLAEAETLVPARNDRVIESIRAAADALYVLQRDGIYSRLLRVPTGTRSAKDIPLPFKGYVSAVFTDPRSQGLTLTLESWNVPPTVFAYDPRGDRFSDLALGTNPPYRPDEFEVRDLNATARDGTQIPLTFVEPTGTQGTRTVLLDAYGSYGISFLPEFNARIISFMREGAAYAVCHVRGGGELGEAWRLAGKDAQKPNTWRDLIACAEDLIALGLTTKDKLFITGGSAGGITVGRAMTERPDLFAGVIDRVPAANALRMEFSPSGPPNIPEFGTVTNEEGFKNLLAMDSYQAVKGGTQYPAVLITAGLNDPRVASWEPAKFAARLQASDTTNPVLLRVEEEAGHGIGSTKTQKDQEWADIGAFIFWRAGREGWQPTGAGH